MSDPNHPVWPIVRQVALLLCVTLLLWVNATKFDATEIRTILGVIITGGAIEGATVWLQRKGKST